MSCLPRIPWATFGACTKSSMRKLETVAKPMREPEISSKPWPSSAEVSKSALGTCAAQSVLQIGISKSMCMEFSNLIRNVRC